jgi:hypothetical protein
MLMPPMKGVYLGSGVGSMDDVVDASVAYHKGVSYQVLTAWRGLV